MGRILESAQRMIRYCCGGPPGLAARSCRGDHVFPGHVHSRYVLWINDSGGSVPGDAFGGHRLPGNGIMCGSSRHGADYGSGFKRKVIDGRRQQVEKNPQPE